jgi:hypothetical protein
MNTNQLIARLAHFFIRSSDIVKRPGLLLLAARAALFTFEMSA